MSIEPYLFFDGRCEEAIEFYRKALGAELTFMMRMKDSPEPPDPAMCPPGAENNVMHAAITIGDTLVMVSDGMGGGKTDFRGFSLSITAQDVAHADRLFNALGEGGRIEQPLTATFFSPRFGMVADKFGVSWMVYVPGPQPK